MFAPEIVCVHFVFCNQLTTYSSSIDMPDFLAVIMSLSAFGILIYVFFFLVVKKCASWEV